MPPTWHAGGASSLVVDAEIVAVDRGHPAAAGGGAADGAAASDGAGAAAAEGGGGGDMPDAAAGDGGGAAGGRVRLRAFQELSTRARGDITTDQVRHSVMSTFLNRRLSGHKDPAAAPLQKLSNRARGDITTTDQVGQQRRCNCFLQSISALQSSG